MLKRVDTSSDSGPKLLLIDTCGESAGVALSLGQQVIAAEELAPRSASAELLGAVRRLLRSAGWKLAELQAVGVVNGPGSFTGVRTGLAAAKGLCEAAGLRLAAVSRLTVLAQAVRNRAEGAGGQAEAARERALAVLDAGRAQVYVRDPGPGAGGREWLCSLDELKASTAGRCLVLAEARLAERLADCELILRPLSVADVLMPVLHCLREGGSDVATADANYVRGEADIYRLPGGTQASRTS
jgi:tRNA threonylcarbamoyladenosine biosynthesis protein TsaB